MTQAWDFVNADVLWWDWTAVKGLSDRIANCRELSIRTDNCLRNAGIVTVSDLIQKTRGELLRIENFGYRSLLDVEGFLQSRGLQLKSR